MTACAALTSSSHRRRSRSSSDTRRGPTSVGQTDSRCGLPVAARDGAGVSRRVVARRVYDDVRRGTEVGDLPRLVRIARRPSSGPHEPRIVHSRISKYNRILGKYYDEVYAAGPHARSRANWSRLLEPDKASPRPGTDGRRSTRAQRADVIPMRPRQLHALLPVGKERSRLDRAHSCRLRLPARSSHAHVTRRTAELARVAGAKLPKWVKRSLTTRTTCLQLPGR